VIPAQFPEANTILAAGQNDYEPLPVYRAPDGRVVCCFRLAPAELTEIQRTRTLWMQQLTFGSAFQPVALSTQRPNVLLGEPPTPGTGAPEGDNPGVIEIMTRVISCIDEAWAMGKRGIDFSLAGNHETNELARRVDGLVAALKSFL
jgi:hypothetical protein